jgi:hypothetical protein
MRMGRRLPVLAARKGTPDAVVDGGWPLHEARAAVG